MDALPGPVNRRLIDIDINNKSNSYPLTKPFGSLATIVAPRISIINRIEAILVKIPTINATPPITSSNPINIAKSGGNPIFPKILQNQQRLKVLATRVLLK